MSKQGDLRPVATMNETTQKKTVTMPRWAILLGTFLLGMLTSPVLFFAYSSYKISPASWPSQEFNGESWRKSEPQDRYAYYKDLAAKGVLDGLSRQEVVGLLGEPDWWAPQGDYCVYGLKRREPCEISFNAVYLLHIDFSEQGEVRAYRVRSD